MSIADPAEFRQLVEGYQDRVFRLVASVLGPYRDADAEDVTQEVFLQVYRSLDRFRGEAQITTWLYRIAYNRALDFRKQARFRLPHVHAGVLLAMAGDAPEPEHDRLLIAECLEALPEIYRTLLYLYYWQETSVDEAAELTGLPAGTVKSYLARGRQRMERELARRGMRRNG